jgi:hypothetical protein
MKNAITILTRGYKDESKYDKLISRNHSITTHIISKLSDEDKLNTDIIFFHEGNISENNKKYIKEKSNFDLKLNIIFIDVKITEPKTGYDDSRNKYNNVLCPPTELSETFPLGYKHMCHFWSIDFLYYLKNYKYIIRIDEDCIVTRGNVNIFDLMKINDLKFLSPFYQGHDNPKVTVGLKTLLDDFLQENQITSKVEYQYYRFPYTNFMVVDIQYFLNHKKVIDFLTKVDKSNGIYSNRWGDLPIWGIILFTLIDSKFYGATNHIAYVHDVHVIN